MDIVNPRLLVSQVGGNFDLFVEYTATFVPAEVQNNFEFEDTIVFADKEVGGDSEFELFDPDVRTTGQRFRPNGQSSVPRKRERLGVSQDDLNTEVGSEDLIGLVHLRNITLQGQNIRKRTAIIEIDA